MLQVINAADREVADAVAREIPAIARAVDAIAAALAPERGGRLFYVGAGTSGRLGVLDASECPPTFNVPATLVQGFIAGGDYALRHSIEGAEDSAELGATDLRAHGFTANDVLAGIAASGRTPYVLGAMDYARSLGAVTIGVSCVPDSEVARAAQIAITPAVGPEVITGSTRLRAGTATKLVLNMLSTGAMIKLGMVYSNLMVNVQPTNEKLADRAERIVVELTGLPRERASSPAARSGIDQSRRTDELQRPKPRTGRRTAAERARPSAPRDGSGGRSLATVRYTEQDASSCPQIPLPQP